MATLELAGERLVALPQRVVFLPALGEFAGMHRVQTLSGDRVFVVLPDRVQELPSSATTSSRPG